MRAIVKVKSRVDSNKLDDVLKDAGWWPNLAQDHEEIIKRRDELLDHVAPEDVRLVKETLLFTIYDDITKSWGIVNSPTTHHIDFRIRNRDSDHLKNACERLVADIQRAGKSVRREEDADFSFSSKIEVFEPNSSDHAYYGDILPRKRFTYARHRRQTEFWVGVLAAIVGLVLLVLALPPIANQIFASFSPDWQEYLKGFVDRLATSAIVTATVSLLNVFLFWLDFRRKPIINWNV
jgi:hypothetical protein